MLVLTQGDPASIAPEITAAVWQKLRQSGPAFVYVGDPSLLERRVPVQTIRYLSAGADIFSHALPVLPLHLATPPAPGEPDRRNAACVIESIRLATELALSGEASAVITNPISKDVVQGAGFRHPGHTSYLAELCQTLGNEVMLLAGPSLKVVPITVHVALRDAIAQLSTELIVRTARTVAAGLQRDFGLPHPRLAFAGLNPHAGEHGLMGHEECEIILPAINTLRAEGLDVSGPWPSDTMFTPHARAHYDVALCMYHDQGLIPLKTLDMAEGVNVTLGLPIIRTSPDHGTAFDIAGQNKADPRSLEAAIRLAATLAANRKKKA